MTLPLQGIRVLDLSRVLAGPLCTMILADLGADVVKIEPPQGDDTRSWGPPFRDGVSAYFASVNRNKRSIVLNLKQDDDKAFLKKLLKKADVVVENYLPASAAKLGLSPEDIQTIKPGIVHASITGFGHSSQWRNVPGYDFAIQALSGMMAITGEIEGRPMKVGVALTDVTTGLYAAVGILSQLLARDRKQPVEHVDVNLLQCAIASLVNVMSAYLMTGHEAKRYGNAHAQIVPYQTFATQDGYMVVAVGNDEQFARFCQLLQKSEWAQDPRFATNPARVQHRDELAAAIEKVMRQQPNESWRQKLVTANIPHGAVQTIGEAMRLAEKIYPDAILTDDAGIKTVRSPIQLGKQLQQKPRTLPSLGGDRAAVEQDWV